MSYKPILFSTPMVQAILDGRKTQARRIVKTQFEYSENTDYGFQIQRNGFAFDYCSTPKIFAKYYAPYKVGDVLWVRETHLPYKDEFFYIADNYHLKLEKLGIKFKWKPSIHIPKAAARIFLKVTDVRVERVQDISEEDAIAEGAESMKHDHIGWHSFRRGFQALWDSINAKRGYGWDTNPWVWVYTFERSNTNWD